MDPISAKLRIGISSCLLGNEVRYDGGHRLNRYIITTFADRFDFVDYCPEVAIGLGTPREPIRLTAIAGEIRVREIKIPDDDVTVQLRNYATHILSHDRQLSGYIVKQGSPSCGMQQVPVYSEGKQVDMGIGEFTRTIIQLLPRLPVEEEGRLTDPLLLESFITRVFRYHKSIITTCD